jgi:hypothetical protein
MAGGFSVAGGCSAAAAARRVGDRDMRRISSSGGFPVPQSVCTAAEIELFLAFLPEKEFNLDFSMA